MRSFITSIKTLFLWLPIIWNDRQWDSWYYEKILLHKITLQRKYIEKRQFFVGWENEVKWIKKCEYLLTMLVENKYWLDEWDSKKPSNNGISTKLLKWQKLKEANRTPYTGEFKFLNSVNTYADFWEDKTRALFWKIFVWRYERWWD